MWKLRLAASLIGVAFAAYSSTVAPDALSRVLCVIGGSFCGWSLGIGSMNDLLNQSDKNFWEMSRICWRAQRAQFAFIKSIDAHVDTETAKLTSNEVAAELEG